MLKKVTQSLVMIAILGTVNSAFARNVWRECGIGGMIFTNTSWAAITSNIIWDLGTTASSSAASSPDLCEGPSASSAEFVYETYANMEEETVMGSGAHLTAMLNIMGCESASHPAIIDSMRGDILERMSSTEYNAKSQLEKAQDYHRSLMSNIEGQFQAQCAI